MTFKVHLITKLGARVTAMISTDTPAKAAEAARKVYPGCFVNKVKVYREARP